MLRDTRGARQEIDAISFFLVGISCHFSMLKIGWPSKDRKHLKCITAADEQDRAQAEKLAETVQQITGQNVELAYVDQGYTGESAAQAAEKHGVQLEVVKHTEAKRGFVLLPRRWVVERSFAWAARFRRLARDYERLSQTLAGLRYLAFANLMLANLIRLITQSS